MKPTKDPSAQIQKWGLFVLLAGSVGFSLSMNPDHFNNIARNEGPVHSIELAATSETATGSGGSVAAAVPPGEEAKLREREIPILGNGSACIVSLGVFQGVTIGKFRSLPQGQPCKLDKKIKQFSTTNLEDLNSIQAEVLAMLSETSSESSDSDKDSDKDGERKKVQKAGYATEVDLDKWAEKCEKVSDEGKLDCHKKRLIELSKYLANTSETSGEVAQYFQTHLASEIRNGLQQPTIRETSAASCEGTIIYMTQFGQVGCYMRDELEQATELTEELIKGLRAGNGKKVVDQLIKSRAGGFSAQLRHSQALAVRGFEESDPKKFSLGMNGMDYNSQMSQLNAATSSLFDSISGMTGSAQQKSLLKTAVQNSMYTPVSTILNQMKQSLLTQNTTNNTNPLFAFQIPQLDGESFLLPSGGTVPGIVPTFTNRNVRGGNSQLGPVTGTFQPLQNRLGVNQTPVGPYWLNPGQTQTLPTTNSNGRNARR